MISFKQYVTELLKRDVHVGDKVKNINPDCEHHGTEGEVKKIVRRTEEGSDKVSNHHNIPGSDVVYKVTNDTKNAHAGDELKKSLDQLKKK